jgi:cytochrome c553
MRSVVREIAPGEEEAILKFLAALPATRATATVEGDATRGGKLYGESCAACHGPQGHGNQALHAPDLTRLNDWYIVSAFQRYQSGVRGGDADGNLWAHQMHLIVRDLPADYGIADVARWLATQSGTRP